MPKSLRPLLAVLAALLALAPAASAAGTPNISLAKSAPAKQLYGTDATVSLTAANPNGQPYGYNVSFRDVLPAGTHYVAGSAAPLPDPTIRLNKPSTGQTTLIFSNLADLSPGSTFTVTYKVAHDTTGGSALRVGDTYADDASAYVQSDPRFIPKFDSNGVAISSSFTGSATASAKTLLVPFTVVKDEPSPEGELLRGAHDHQTVYTVTVQNNKVNQTTGIQVDDYLPAGLEFLGCGDVDNTTNAPTNSGSNREYPGASALNGHTSSPSQCLTAKSVETVQTDPDGSGPLPNGVYTHVVWSLGSLAPNAIGTIRYVAAIPARSNTMTWSGGSAPSPTGLKQTANLDNNSGPEMRDETGLTNYAVGTGTYAGPVHAGTANPASVETWLTRTAEDLRILKSSDKGGIAQGDITKWTLTLDTSEYRSVTGITVTDKVPNGLCPLGSANFEHTPPAASSECDPAGVLPSLAYAGSPVENADGTWAVSFKPADLPVNGHAVITFPTRTRSHYQKNFADDTQVLANDDWLNTVHTDGTNHARVANGKPIDHDAGYDGVTIIDDSQSGQAASGTSVEKWVAKDGTTLTGACPTSTSSYTKDSAQAQSYGPGDVVCYRVRIQFSSSIDTKIDPITDFLPASEDYVVGSTVGLSGNTVPGSLTATASGQIIKWAGVGVAGTPSGTRVIVKHSPAYVFDVVFKAAISRPSTQTPGDLVDNLVKFSNRNTPDASFPSRADVDHGWLEAQLAISKGVKTVKRGSTTVEGPNGPNVDHRPVQPGDVVTWRIDVTNKGNRDAKNGEVWDLLPPKVVCADVSNITNGGTCSDTLVGGQPGIAWTGIAVAKGKSVERDFDMVVKKDTFAPGEQLDNKTGVRQYTTDTNTGGTFTYIPSSNVDSTQNAKSNTGRADDVSDVYIPGSLVGKTRTTQLKDGGNRGPGDSPDDQATIGENVLYAVKATLPANTILNAGHVTDQVPDGLVLDPASVTATLDGAALPAGWSVATSPTSLITVTMPATVVVGAKDRVVAIAFTARVADIPANVAGTVVTNVANMDWKDSKNAPQTASSAKIPTTVVEPKLVVAKVHDGPDTVAPGAAVTFHVTASNGTGANVSTAHEVTLVDTLPAGFCVVSGSITGGGIAAGACGSTPQTITWTLAKLDPGETHTFDYKATVPSPVVAGSALTNPVDETGTSMPGTPPGERTYTVPTSDTVTAVTPTIAKAVSPAQATNGTSLTYTITIALPANLALNAAHVDDALPAGVAFDKQDSFTCTSTASCGFTPPTAPTSTAGPITWSLGDVPSAPAVRTLVITYDAHVTAAAADGKLTNTATLAWKTAEGKDGSIQATATTTVAHPVVRLNKHVSCDGATVPVQDTDSDACSVVPGAPETYSIVVRNDGTSPAYDIQVVDTPDPGLTSIANISNGGVLAGGKITWTLPGPLAPGDHTTVTYTAKVGGIDQITKGQKIVNTVAIPHYFGLPKVDRDKHPADAKDYTDANTDTVTLTGDFNLADVAVLKTGTPSIQPGGTILYDVTVTNNGPDPAVNTKLVDTVPAGLTIDPASVAVSGGSGTCSVSGQIITCTLGTLASGDVRHVKFSAAAAGLPDTLPQYVNTAAATTDTLESTTANNAASFTTNVPWGDVGIVKSVSSKTVQQGQKNVDWTLVVTNHGPSTATGVKLADPLPAGVIPTGLNFSPATAAVKCAALPAIDCTLPDLAPGQSIVFVIHTSISTSVALGPLTNTGTVSSTNDSNPSNDSSSATTNVAAAAPRVSDVQIVKSTPTPRVPAGNRATFTLVVKNNGPDDATDVTVVDPMPAGMTLVSAKPAQGSCTGTSAITCRLGTIANGKTVTITVTVTTSATVGTFTNTGTVTTSSTDSNPGNNTSSAKVTTFKAKARIRLTKLVDKHAAKAGQILHYTIVLRVLSDVAATNVKVCDTPPPHTTFVSAPGGFFVRGQVCWTRKLVKAHGTVRFRITVRIDRDAPSGRIRNTAVATISNGARAVARARTKVTSINDAGGVGGVTG